MSNKTVMDVKILGEAGLEFALQGIATNKKKYDRDMYPVSLKLYKAGGGHDKFLQMISVWIGYTTSRSIHQQIDTYRVGITKSSESTHHMLIQDVLNKSINLEKIQNWFQNNGYVVNVSKMPGRELPINATGLLISKNNKNILTKDELKKYMETYLVVFDPTKLNSYDFDEVFFNNTCKVLSESFNIDYEAYYDMFEGREEAITKETIDIMVDLALSLDEDRYGKLHRLKRMLPEGFLQYRVMHCNYKALRTMLWQRFNDQFEAWQEWCKQIILQVEHPEYFEDILEANHTSIEELRNDMCNGKHYGV